MNEQYGPSLLRLVLGALFLFTGIGKLVNPAMITGMLEGLGFPAAAFFAWILILVEVLGGLAILLGWKLKYTVWLLVVVLVVAIITVHWPNTNFADAMTVINLFWHILGIAALISLALTGPGAIAVSKE